MLTQNFPLASMARHARDCLVGQNNTSGGSSDSAANDWQAKPIGTSSWRVVMTGDAGTELAEHISERARIDRGTRHDYLKPTEKS